MKRNLTAILLALAVAAAPTTATTLNQIISDMPAPDLVPMPVVPAATVQPTALLVVNVADPEHPVATYTGSGPRAQVKVLGVAAMAGGFSLVDPTGAARFTNQFSDGSGVVDFFDVTWENPYGRWTVTFKPGFPAITPELQPGQVFDPVNDPATYAEQVLLTFTIDALTATASANMGGPAPESVSLTELKDGVTDAGANPTAAPTSSSENDPEGVQYSGRGDCQGECEEARSESDVDPNTGNSGPPGYIYCSTENTRCEFPDTRDVAYGANGNFHYRYDVTGGIDCNNAVFGDPYYGIQKACYTRPYTAYVGPPGYAFCSYENQYCSFPNEVKDVAYGNHGAYFHHFNVMSGTPCNNQAFGDPSRGTGKACWIRDSGTSGNGGGSPTRIGPSGYAWCADEGQWCSFSGTKAVAYGANGYYSYRYGVTGGISCSNEEFGDPVAGTGKSCYTYGGSSTQTGCTNWQMRANHWKWINTVITHAPYGGTAQALSAAGTTREEYYFGSASSKQTVAGETLSTQNGFTTGLYKLMTAAYYTCDINSWTRVELTDHPTQADAYIGHLEGSSTWTDEDDLTGFWGYSGTIGQSVQSVTLYHQFRERDDARTIDAGSAVESCRWITSEDGKVMGIELSLSFTPAGGPVSVSGTMSYKTTRSETFSYQYCFGANHRYEWDNLGRSGPTDRLGAAFRTIW